VSRADWTDEPAADVGTGSATTVDAGELGPTLLEAVAVLSRLRVLLDEATADERRAWAGRIASVRSLASSIPPPPAPRRAAGFAAPPPKRKRRA
jgi:hypothetical protein